MFEFLKRSRSRPTSTVEAEPPTVEVGSFAHGVCEDCEWRGPGRRARSLALSDARAHSCEGERLTA